MPVSRVKQIEYQRRCAEVLDHCLAGLNFARIAEVLNCNPTTVSRMYHHAMAETVRPGADEYRQVQRLRLETLIKTSWPRALTGDRYAIHNVRGLIKDIRELEGLDAPLRVNHTISDEMTDEVRRLAALLGVHDPDVIAEPHRSML